MTHTAFFDVARQTAHAALNGSQQPALGGKLLTHLKIIAKGFVGDAVVTVDAGTAEFLILAKTSASGAASLIDTTAVLNTSDPDEPQYEFEWNPADSIQLRAVLDAAADLTAPVELRYEFRFERSGNKGCIGGPIYFLNNFFRPETPAPVGTADSSWEWIKSRLAAGDNVTRIVNEVTKVITFSVPDFADGEDGREIELQASGTHIQWRYVGAPTWTNLVALSAITGPAGTNGVNGSNGTNGSSVEMQVTGTHIQWRLVGAPTWTNLIALATITGPAGTNGSAGSDGLSAYQIAVNNGFIGNEAAWLTSLMGEDGGGGDHGWSPQFGVVGDGERRVLQLMSWVGGSGSNPGHVNEYVGASGFTTELNQAIDIRGAAGQTGANGETGATGGTGGTGETGATGATGAEATPITNITNDGNGNLTIYTAGTTYGPFALKGPQGDAGSTGGTGADGAPGASLIWRGPWATDTSYAPLDVVSHGGSSYINVTATTDSVSPDVNGNWQLMAQRGAQSTVTTLSLSISDPPTYGEVEAVLNKLNELITALNP